MMKQPAKTDVAVLVLFFNRPDHLAQLFQRIREARPSALLLWQDGSRGSQDEERMEQCRQLVSDERIDWQCQVHRAYQTVNRGCDPSSYMCIKWAFSLYDKVIKLEDDDLPSLSFFPFCKEMLDRYENDTRVHIINGMNHDEVTPDCPYSYFFTTTFSINGWASWRRVIDLWDDERYRFLDDAYAMRLMRDVIRERHLQKDFERFCQYHRSLGKAYYETIFHAEMLLQSGLSIIPTRNMIQNAGASDEGTHYAGSNDLLPARLRRLFSMPAYEVEGFLTPTGHDASVLRHPPCVIEDVAYRERMFRTFAWGHPWVKVGRSLEELWLNLRKGNIKRITSAVKNRVNIWLGRTKWD